LLLRAVLFATTVPLQLSSVPPGMLFSVLDVDVVDCVVVVGHPVVVPAVDDETPPAAYPKRARKSMKMMNPNAVSVASSAMLCLDQYRAKHLTTALPY
jgi:hypothetical protein